MRRTLLLSLGLATVVALPSVASAQQVKAGAEFAVTTYTTGNQGWPDVHYQANGNFIVTWGGVTPLDGSYGVLAQRYDAAGTPLGGQFRVNTYTPNYQYRPLTSSDAKGNFVVVWGSQYQDGDGYGVFAQRYDANGAPRGGEFQVNTYTTGYQGSSYLYLINNTGVAMNASGNFIVVWGSYSNGTGNFSAIEGQRFDANGVRVGTEFRINTSTAGYRGSPSVALYSNGSFVVVWTEPDSSYYGITGQRFNASGVKVGAEFQVNNYTTGYQLSATVRINEANSDFVVVWSDRPTPDEMFARRFDVNGTPLGGAFQVNTYTTGYQYSYGFSMDKRGNFVVHWNRAFDGNDVTIDTGIGGRRFLADGTPRDPEFVVNTYTTGVQHEVQVSSDDVGNVVAVWRDINGSNLRGIFGQRFGGLRPTALSVDAANNGVWEPGETAVVAPTWRNFNGAAQTFGGTLANITGPAGATYGVPDGTASYGTVANNTSAPCTDCYSVTVDNPTTRPVQHWDASVVETITPDTQGQQKGWTLHIGKSFTDVPNTNPFYRFVETLLHKGVTGGCGGTNYCPSTVTTRDQMSVFVLVAKEGAGYTPVACGTPVFADVPASNPFCRFIEELSRRGVVGGCGGNNYCPTSPVTREQMAIFVLRTLDPALNPPACVAPNMFADVPETSPFCRWIEELANRGVVTGCGGSNYCPTATVTREQMGVFISATFGLALYGT